MRVGRIDWLRNGQDATLKVSEHKRVAAHHLNLAAT